ncbi:hypothetical protein CHL78_006400 [Romboutsia weinsteinii]|uniref:XRE family transcriptional regulator n=1 Tax=Romboutsia weinsteinii TaxID=2020949 RepID=A0A371J654_9FIRM|nr:hypothetical protein [Romboutsia weinsteinii]RDY28214.1 hypothetical protein CHL78_006400 [Romboutsia weinsteinii]
MNNIETVELMSLLNNIDDEANLNNFLSDKLSNIKNLNFPNYFEQLLKQKGISKSTAIKNADIDRTYGYEILRGDKKPSRDKILQLCIGAGFTLEECNKALKLGNVSELYPKIPRDSIIIFGINRGIKILEINTMLYNRKLNTLGEE